MSAKQTTSRARPFQTVLVLGVLLFAGSFLLAQFFGIYDDDFIFTVPPFAWSWTEARAHVLNSLLSWPQGRPVAFALTHLLSYLSAQSSSLGMGYLTGYAILLLNAILLERLARRFLSAPAALLTAAIYVLYPADMSKAILMHRVFLHLNLTFLLTSLLCYVNGRRWVACLVAPLCFLIYEPVFLVFLLAPLLVATPRDFAWKRSLLHGLFCVATIALLLLVRRHVGDQRVAETFGDPVEVVQRIVQALWIGPKTVITALVARPFEALYATDAQVWIPVLLCAGAFFTVAHRQKQSSSSKALPRANALWVAGVGAVGLLLGYAVCFRIDYWPPIMTIGRLSGYHAAGSIGAALMVGALFSWALEFRPQLRRWLIAAAALYCGLLVSFGIEVQRIDYVKHAEQQARFWRTILDTSGEWKPGTVILVDISGNDASRPFTPGMPLWWTVNFAPTLLENLVQWPSEWTAQATQSSPQPMPRAYGFLSSFESLPEGDAIVIKTPAWLGPAFWPRVRDGGFIYFRFAGGRMVRVTEPVRIGDRDLHPMAAPALPVARLQTKHLYDVLFARETEWKTILNARNYPR